MNKLVASVAVAASVILPMAAFDLQREIDAALGNAACGAEFALGVGAYEGRCRERPSWMSRTARCLFRRIRSSAWSSETGNPHRAFME